MALRCIKLDLSTLKFKLTNKTLCSLSFFFIRIKHGRKYMHKPFFQKKKINKIKILKENNSQHSANLVKWPFLTHEIFFSKLILQAIKIGVSKVLRFTKFITDCPDIISKGKQTKRGSIFRIMKNCIITVSLLWDVFYAILVCRKYVQ